MILVASNSGPCSKLISRFLKRNSLLTFLCLVWAAGTFSNVAQAGDWPQILGPDRNGIAKGETIRVNWNESSPSQAWSREVGTGHAGVAVSQGQVFLFHRHDDKEIVEALDSATGDRLWDSSFPASYRPSVVPNDGPLCVPTVAGEYVVVLGAAGDLRVLSINDGSEAWSRSFGEEFGAPSGYFGAGSAPLVYQETVLVNVGGRGGTGIMAFSLRDGQTLWQTSDEKASYSSPVLTSIDGQPTVIFVTRLAVMALDPRNGNVLRRTPFGKLGPTVNAASPLVFGDYVLCTASYQVGARLLRHAPREFQEIWSKDDVMSSQYSTSILVDRAVYGIHGRADLGRAHLRCIDPLSGELQWSEDNFGMATMILAGSNLLALTTEGEFVAMAPSTSAYQELARIRVSEHTCRALPALSDGLLYVRDERRLTCWNLRLQSGN